MLEQPFQKLSPDCVMDAMCSIGLFPDGRLLALNSYENRVYQVGMEEGPPLIVKFYRPNRWSDAAILEEHRFVDELYSGEIPVVPASVIGGTTLHVFEQFRFSVFPRQGGRAPELDQTEVLEWTGRMMGRIHAVGQKRRFEHRPSIDRHTFGEQARDYLIAHNFIPHELQEAWTTVINMALQEVAACYQRAGDIRTIRLHGDCHSGNLLWTDHGPHFVDFDDARNGPAMQDLWMLLSGSKAEMAVQLSVVLEGYEQFADFNTRELHLIEALRTLRLIHYSAWLAQRWHDPAFPAAFPWFNTTRYWQDRILELKEQVALMQEPALTLPGF